MNRFAWKCIANTFCVLALCVIANVIHAGTMGDIVKSRKLTVAVQSEGPPISFENEKGKRTGLAVEFIRMMVQDMDVELVMKEYTWKGLLPALENDEVDIVAADLSPSPKQLMKTLFTDTVFYNETVAFTKKERPYQHWRDLNRRYISISVSKDTRFADTVRKFLPEAKLRQVKDGVIDIVPDILEGRALAGVSSRVSLHPFLGDESELKVIGEPITREPMAFAVAPESIHLLLFVNNYIELVKNDGRLQELLDYWWYSMDWQEDN